MNKNLEPKIIFKSIYIEMVSNKFYFEKKLEYFQLINKTEIL